MLSNFEQKSLIVKDLMLFVQLGRLYLVSCSASESVWFGRESYFLYTAHYIQNPVFFLGGGGADRRPKILSFFVF